MDDFYRTILEIDSIPVDNFPRTEAFEDRGYSGQINFFTEGKIEMHLAERGLDVAFRNNQMINPVDKGHIAFRTDNIKDFLEKLDAAGVRYSDYGTTFAKEWHQVFFHDPEGNVIEVHQRVDRAP